MKLKERGHAQADNVSLQGGSRTSQGYEVRVSETSEDDRWDSLLASIPGDHHAQLSAWSQVKAALGWRPIRLMLLREGTVVAGVQVLLRRVGIFGTVGIALGGPYVADDAPDLWTQIMAELERLASARHITYLLVQPSYTGRALPDRAGRRSASPLLRDVLQTSTVVLDLELDGDELLRRMRKSTRRNIRLAQRRGVVVRQADASDIPAFHRMLVEGRELNQRPAYALEHFHQLWRILAPRGLSTLFLAEVEGETVAGSLLLTIGDTVTDWIGGWSGRHRTAHATELLEWTAIAWAKSQGYSRFDFDGIDPGVAHALLDGEPVGSAQVDGVTNFKLGFGGEITVYPPAVEYIPRRLLKLGYHLIWDHLASRSATTRLVNLLRTIRYATSDDLV